MTYGVNAPLGLVPCSYLASAPWTGGFIEVPITAGLASNIFTGDLVTYAAGAVILYTAANVTGTIGVFIGCNYVDAQNVPHFSPYWPANQTIAPGTTAYAKVIIDTNTEYNIQATGAVVTANIDFNADVTFATLGNPATGLSGMALNTATIAVTNTLPLRIIAFTPVPGNITGVPFNNVLVKLNQSAFISGTTGV
jgi:hypothetical protein